MSLWQLHPISLSLQTFWHIYKEWHPSVLIVDPGEVDQWVSVSDTPGIQHNVIDGQDVADGHSTLIFVMWTVHQVWDIPHLMVTFVIAFELAYNIVPPEFL